MKINRQNHSENDPESNDQQAENYTKDEYAAVLFANHHIEQLAMSMKPAAGLMLIRGFLFQVGDQPQVGQLRLNYVALFGKLNSQPPV